MTLRGLSWDLAAAGFLMLALLIFGLSGGKRTLISFVIALYVGNAVVGALPATQLLSSPENSPWPAIMLLVVTVFFTFVFANFSFGGLFSFSFWQIWTAAQIFGLSVIGAGFFIASLLRLLPEGIPISGIMYRLFVWGPAPLVWSVLPALFLLALRSEPPRRRKLGELDDDEE